MTSFNHDLREEIRKTVIQTLTLLQERELQLPRITEINVYNIPVGVLSYQLYDSKRIERTQTLINLNNEKNPILFDEDVNILNG